MPSNYCISIDAISDIECKLNAVPYDGDCPTGSLIAAFLYIELYQGRTDYSVKVKFRDFFFRQYILFIGTKWVRQNKTVFDKWIQYKNRHLLTITDKRANFKGMVFPILNYIDERDYVVFAKQDCVDTSMSNIILWDEIPSISLKEWRRKIATHAEVWKRIINEWIEKYKIKKWVKYKMINNLISQTLYYESLKIFLKQLSPKSITTEYDRNWFAAPLVAAAHSLGISTTTLLHGVVNNSIGYTPIIADKISVWGQRQKKQLINFGLASDKIFINGASHLSNRIQEDKNIIRQKMGFNDTKPVVVFGSCNIEISEMHKLMELFCKAFDEQSSFHAVVKLHPQEPKEFYSEEINIYKNIYFCASNELGLEESFALADIVCVYNSAYGTDAVLKGIPVVVMDIHTNNGGNADELISANMPVANSSKEIIETCIKLVNDFEYSQKVKNTVVSYANAYCTAFENVAAKNIATFIVNSNDVAWV